MKILQICTGDSLGGANKLAWSHMDAFRQRGHNAKLLVSDKVTNDPDVLVMRDLIRPGAWTAFWQNFHRRAQRSASYQRNRRLQRWVNYLARPRAAIEGKLGLEDFQYPATGQILRRLQPSVIHCHNLHTRYFDLRALPYLSSRVPVFLSLHDEWLITGHCSSTFECMRWQNGCGHCPDIRSYPAIQRDATAYNARRKQSIYRRSRLHIIVASELLKGRVEKSILADSNQEAHVIPNGVDLTIFCPGDKRAARSALGLPTDAKILLFAAVDGPKNAAKDYVTLRSAIELIGQWRPYNDFVLVSIGQKAGQGTVEQIGNSQVRLLPFEHDARRMAQYYQAADAYVHSAHTDTFPLVVLEAMACCAPIVATSVGGIPEQITTPEQSSVQANGLLTPRADPEAMAKAILMLLENDALRERLAANAVQTAQARFGLDRQIQATETLYEAALSTYALR